MTLQEFKLLTDENIHVDVVEFLRDEGFDVLDVCEEGLQGATDVEVLRRAVSEDHVVLTHDRDFGTLAVLGREPVIGIVYLRPGHLDATFTTESIEAVVQQGRNLTPPFILVVERKGSRVTIRYRLI